MKASDPCERLEAPMVDATRESSTAEDGMSQHQFNGKRQLEVQEHALTKDERPAGDMPRETGSNGATA